MVKDHEAFDAQAAFAQKKAFLGSVPGPENPADLGTKNYDRSEEFEKMKRLNGLDTDSEEINMIYDADWCSQKLLGLLGMCMKTKEELQEMIDEDDHEIEVATMIGGVRESRRA